MKIDELARVVEEIAPLELQEPWDHSGWQLKLIDGEVRRVLTALEINEQVADEAVRLQADLILTHHPFLFGPLREIDCGTVLGSTVIKLVQNGISVYSTHTPFDKCSGGNNDDIGRRLRLEAVKPMKEDQDGYCRTGMLAEPMTAEAFVFYAAEAFQISPDFFSFAGPADDMVRKIGWCSGAGADFLDAAFDAGCDLFLTGDVKYHTAQHARDIGMNLLDCGHYATERIFAENLTAQLTERLHPQDRPELLLSRVDLNPFVRLGKKSGAV